MKKRIVCLTLAAAMLLSMAGCRSAEPAPTEAAESTVIRRITFNCFSAFSVRIKIPRAQRNLMDFPSDYLLPGVFMVSYLFVT